jgi:excisionase family DNA binding protein
METSPLLTVPEFALSLRMKDSGVRRWIRERKIIAVHVGRLVRIPRSEVDRIIAEGTCPAKGVR